MAAAALRDAGLRPEDIRGIGITNQRETVVLWDRATGKPVGRAIVWQDRRTAGDCDALRARSGLEARLRERTGLVIAPYFSATKVKWLLDETPGLRARAERGEIAFGTVDSWLVWQMTGGRVHATDYSNASRTMLYDIHALRWDPEILGLLDIPAAILPVVLPSSHLYGMTDPDSFLGAKIPVAGGAGGDVLSDPRRGRGDGARVGHRAARASRRRRRFGQRLAHAISGRHPRRFGQGAARSTVAGRPFHRPRRPAETDSRSRSSQCFTCFFRQASVRSIVGSIDLANFIASSKLSC